MSFGAERAVTSQSATHRAIVITGYKFMALRQFMALCNRVLYIYRDVFIGEPHLPLCIGLENFDVVYMCQLHIGLAS